MSSLTALLLAEHKKNLYYASMLTRKDLLAIRRIFREELLPLRQDLKSLSLREDVNEIKYATHEFIEDVRDLMALIKMQQQYISDLHKRLERIEKLIFSYSS